MATTFKFDLKNFQRRLSLYEQSQANFAGKVALTKLAKRLKGATVKTEGGTSTMGIRDRYKRIFKNPVPFTLNSTFTVQRELELDVGIKDKVEKGNPAGKYLFPPIGVGSGEAYDTLFTRYLRDRSLINSTDYPYPVRENPLVRKNRFGNVTANTYRNTVIGLGKTRTGGSFSGGNNKIHDARVVNFKNDKIVKKKDGTEKVIKKGIYREQIGRGKNKPFLRPLFFYGSIPTQSKGGAGESTMKGRLFPQIVKEFADAQLFKIWLREIKNLAR